MNIKKYLYWIVALGEIFALIFEVERLHQICKPLLMVTLLVYFWSESDHLKDEKWVRHVTLALAFSWIGDITLMFTHLSFMLFLAGLSAFLVAHIIYVIAYIRATSHNKIQIKFSIVPIVLLLYFILTASQIIPYVASIIQIPIGVYGFTLFVMASVAWYRKGQTNSLSFQWVFVGALLFIVSDSLLAINRFAETLPYANIAVMTTYIAAQWLLVKGLLKHSPNYN
ncbi:MAG: putative membrane protein YhhN [Marivirga sp.]|jgi:uncharacterized membrane protein YhhN